MLKLSLFPTLPLWAGVLLTSVDVLLVLAFFHSSPNTRSGTKWFELTIAVLVFAVFGCFVVLVVRVGQFIYHILSVTEILDVVSFFFFRSVCLETLRSRMGTCVQGILTQQDCLWTRVIPTVDAILSRSSSF